MSVIQEMSSNQEQNTSNNSFVSDYSTILGRSIIQNEITDILTQNLKIIKLLEFVINENL